MKNRLLALTLALLLTLTLAACGEKNENIQDGAASDGETAQDTAASEESEETAKVSIGSVEGSVYTSEFLGIRCSLDSEWTFATQAQLAEMINLDADALEDGELAERMENSATFVDMYASKDEGLTAIRVVLENVDAIYSAAPDESGYLDLGMDKLKESLESTGMEEISVETATMEFAGGEHACARFTASYADIPFYEELICIREGSYMGVITMSCYYENVLPELEQAFRSLES